MKVKFNVVICNLITGEPLKANDGVDEKGQPKSKDLTLGIASLEALLTMDPNRPESGETKAKAYALAARIVKDTKGGGDVSTEISAEEVVLLKSKIGDLFSAAVVGPAYELLEGRVIGEA